MAALTGAVLQATAALAAPDAVRGEIIFLAADRNKDDAVDRAEADSFRVVIFNAIDANKDGRLTPQEVGVQLVPLKEGADQKEQERVAKRREELLAKLDLSKPEGVPEDEYLDRNGALFAQADADKDGRISREEFAAVVEAYGALMPR
ncbi:MAG TPA: hypothetical protein VFK86_11830 [Bauldia sp.]|nr:hypothetical protein [Bauldia sp.]